MRFLPFRNKGRGRRKQSGPLRYRDGGVSEYSPTVSGTANSAQYKTENNPINGSQYFTPVLPDLSDEEIIQLASEITDYQLCHGSVLKHTKLNVPSSGQIMKSSVVPTATTPGTTLHPSSYPRRLFEEASSLQPLFSELYAKVSCDPEWLHSVLEDVVESDDFTGYLWRVWSQTRRIRCNAAARDDNNTISEVGMGIWRADYMLSIPQSNTLSGVDDKDKESGSGLKERLGIKQVEVNTISCAGMVHCERIINMHKLFQRMGRYGSGAAGWEIPENENKKRIVALLAEAHATYDREIRSHVLSNGVLQEQQKRQGKSQDENKQKDEQKKKSCILMIVQPHNYNIADERPIEYGLWSLEPPIPTFRLLWQDILSRTTLTRSFTLLYHHLNSNSDCEEDSQTYEVSTIHLRAGLDPREYLPSTDLSQTWSVHDVQSESYGFIARLQLELSRSIKCPPILAHLAGSKRVQQALCQPGSVERFFPLPKHEDDIKRMRAVFQDMHPLDQDSIAGRLGRQIIFPNKTNTNTNTSTKDERGDDIKNWILKPNREGGGNNIYATHIPAFLRSIPDHKWKEYVLMRKIEPPRQSCRNVLVSKSSQNGLYSGETVIELGVLGGVLWRYTYESNINSNSASTSNNKKLNTSTDDDYGNNEKEDKDEKGRQDARIDQDTSKKEKEEDITQNLPSGSDERKIMIFRNDVLGWSCRTKRSDVDEMSVVKGYGCFDSVVLVDD